MKHFLFRMKLNKVYQILDSNRNLVRQTDKYTLTEVGLECNKFLLNPTLKVNDGDKAQHLVIHLL